MSRLQTKNITITIQNKSICQYLDLTIEAGELWGILGRNGCGKTTLLHSLVGLYPLTQGDIFLNGYKQQILSAKTIAQSIALLFQDVAVNFPQTAWEYCLAGRFPHLAYFKRENEEDREIVLRALHTMDLTTLMHCSIQHFSGGEKRRLAIAAVLAQTPDIYLLDEPTNHLDLHYQVHTLTHFSKLVETKSATVVMTLHDVNWAQQFCHRVLLLFGDGSTLQGKPKDILTAENLTRLYQHTMISTTKSTIPYWRPECV